MGLHDGRDGKTDEGSTAQVAQWRACLAACLALTLG